MNKCKFTMLMALMLLLVSGAAISEVPASGRPMVLPLGDGAVLVSAAGELLTERGVYASILPISDEDTAAENMLFSATPAYDEQQSGLLLLMNAQGEALSDPVYSALYQDGQLVRYVQNWLYGVMDFSLNPIIQCKYSLLVPNGEGGYIGLTGELYDDEPDGVWYIDLMGNEIATGVRVLGSIGEFSDGLCTAISYDTGRLGYLNAKGEWAIAAQLEYGGAFRNGRAEACLESGYGIIDKAGNWLLTPKYQLVSTGFGDSNIILACEDETAIDMIDPRNYRVKKTFKGDEIYFGAYFDRDYVVLYMKDKVELIDEEGNVLLTTGSQGNFDAWYAMGGRVIMREGTPAPDAYLVDVSGEKIAGPFQAMTLIGTGEDGKSYFAFTEGDPNAIDLKAGVMDQDGNVTIQPDERELFDYLEGMLVARDDDEIGLCDFFGNWLIKLKYQG